MLKSLNMGPLLIPYMNEGQIPPQAFIDLNKHYENYQSITYDWQGQANFGNSGSDLLMDFTDGNAGVMVRLRLSNSGALTYTTDFLNELPIGTINLNQKYIIDDMLISRPKQAGE